MQLTTDTERTVQYLIKQFLDLYKLGLDSWTAAGKALVEALEKDPDVFEKIIAQSDGLKMSHLLTFERIGRGEVLPQLLVAESPAARRVLALGYDIERQKTLSELPIEIAHVTEAAGAQAIQVTHKRLGELNASEARIVLGPEGVRPIAEQTALLNLPRAQKPRFRLDEKGVDFYSHTHMGWADLEELLAKRPKVSAIDIQASIEQNQIKAA